MAVMQKKTVSGHSNSDRIVTTEASPAEKSRRRRRKDAKGKPDPKKRVITTAFSKEGPSTAPKQQQRPIRPPPVDVNPYKKTVDHTKEEDFMSNLLGDLASTTPNSFMSASQSRKRKSSPDYNPNSFRSARSNASASSVPSSDDMRPLTDLSSDGLDSDGAADGGRIDYKKPRLGVESQLDDLGFGDTTYEFEAGADFDNMDLDEPPSAQSRDPAVKAEEDHDIGLALKQPSSFATPASKPLASSSRPRTLVNARSTKASVPKPSPLAVPQDEDDKARPNTENKKPKGLDWRLAAANVAIADSSDDQPTAEDLATVSSGAKKGRQTKNANEPAPTTKIDAFEADSSLRFYWLDHVEMNGVVHLTGKVYDKAASDPNKRWVSCCLAVHGIQRNLFVLPRGPKSQERKLAASQAKSQRKGEQKKGTGTLDSDDEAESSGEESSSSESSSEDEESEIDENESEFVPTVDDVEDDFTEVMEQANISKWSSKEVSRKYAFELPGIPAEARYLKVVYGFDRKSHYWIFFFANILYGRTSTSYGPYWPNLQPRLRYQHISL